MVQCEDHWVHPVCALSFPQLYTMENPQSMKFKFCEDVSYE